MVAEPRDEVLRAPDVAANAAHRLLVVAKQEVRAVALRLRALEHIAKVGAWPGEDVTGPAGDLRGDAARDALHEEQLDVLARHAAASLKVSRRSR